jgi:IS6 family transposase
MKEAVTGVSRPTLPDVIVLGRVCRDVRYSFSYRDREKMIAARGLGIEHPTIALGLCGTLAPLIERMRRHVRRPNRWWRLDETDVRLAGEWAYLYRALDQEATPWMQTANLGREPEG